MSRLLAVTSALPPHVHPQAEITGMLGPILAPDPARRALLERLHGASGVLTRHMTLPLEAYADLGSFSRANDLFIHHGTELAARALEEALDAAGLRPSEVDFLLFTTVTGIAAPSIDALLVERLGLRPDVRRMPSFGFGCAGGAAGLARVHDYLVGHPGDVGVLVCLELCSLTLQHGDGSTANLVSSAIFGDGAAAAVLVGSAHPAGARHPREAVVVDSRSRLFSGTGDALGWQVGESGFRIVLSAGLPTVLEAHLAQEVEALLAPHGLSSGDVDRWVVHAGGPKVLDSATQALGLRPEALDRSRDSLAAVGNLSSASVLHVLDLTLGQEPLGPGDVAVLMAFGPGVACELVLLRGPEED
ncbi:type III polyketide synthase [Actinotalea sp.]|uniref:type III polyketide synthase n=1 Tax=Actinotalea sp. TaxID=1872145 RepID=UPI003562B985